MSNLPLGEVITTEQHRDAIHVAVAPVEAAHNLSPGTRIQLLPDGRAATGPNPIGIVDPFLREPVSKGEKFWLFIFPGTVTSLRHEWSHPAFTCCREDCLTPSPVAPEKDAAEKWLREYVKEVCPYSPENYEGFIGHARRGQIFYHGRDCHDASDVNHPEELYRHLSVILGKPVSAASFEFSCSC